MTTEDLDIIIGQRVKLGREGKGVSQAALGEPLGVTFQQIQKYERGKNRVSCSALVTISRTLDLPITWFFQDIQQVRLS